MLDELRGLGIRIHLDDFGTGYSSLSYLHQLPLDGMKVDRSFVRRLDEPRGESIVRTIVELAHSLGMYVLAEGVETREQYDRLRTLGCEHAQGYYLSRPVGAREAGNLLAKEPSWHSAPQTS
jgi:EAL domain-containing protein (putative c-di-GMP-specific phosphodiesterase class I)